MNDIPAIVGAGLNHTAAPATIRYTGFQARDGGQNRGGVAPIAAPPAPMHGQRQGAPAVVCGPGGGNEGSAGGRQQQQTCSNVHPQFQQQHGALQYQSVPNRQTPFGQAGICQPNSSWQSQPPAPGPKHPPHATAATYPQSPAVLQAAQVPTQHQGGVQSTAPATTSTEPVKGFPARRRVSVCQTYTVEEPDDEVPVPSKGRKDMTSGETDNSEEAHDSPPFIDCAAAQRSSNTARGDGERSLTSGGNGAVQHAAETLVGNSVYVHYLETVLTTTTTTTKVRCASRMPDVLSTFRLSLSVFLHSGTRPSYAVSSP